MKQRGKIHPMTKKEIVRTIADKLCMTQLQTKDIVQHVLDCLSETLVDEGRIELRNFGVFEVKKRKARKARNPQTGEAVKVKEKNVVVFKSGKAMEESLQKKNRKSLASNLNFNNSSRLWLPHGIEV